MNDKKVEYTKGRDVKEGRLTNLKKLYLLVFTQHVLRRLSPVWRVFPPMLDEARRVPVDLNSFEK